jgi:hypothetical protein
MARTRSTIFRPILGGIYTVRNIETNEEKPCQVLRLKDGEKYGPVRSGKICVRGEEYFKVFIDGVVHKMGNSLLHKISVSEDGKWEFLDKKLPAILKEKVVKVVEKKYIPKIAMKPKNDHIEFISEPALTKILGA